MSQRTDQVGELIHSELGAILNEELELPEGQFVTIMSVQCPPDLSAANVWLSVIPTEQGPIVLQRLEKMRGIVQRELNKRLTMKVTPRLQWRLDETEAKADVIDRLLDGLGDELKKEPDTKE